MNKSGSLQVQKGVYYTVIRVDGKPKWKTTKIRVEGRTKRESEANLREAQLILAERIRDVETGSPGYCTTKFIPYIEDWLERKKRDVRKSTLEGYYMYLEKHIRPFFAPMKLQLTEVSPMLIQKFIDAKYKDGLSPSSIKKYLVVMSGALDEAVRFNYIRYNPCERVQLPKLVKPETRAYTSEQAKALLSACEKDAIEPAVKLALFLGLRRSEVAGLRWSDVDFQNNIIHIRNTVVKISSVIEEENTKSAASRRDMTMMPALRDYLLALKGSSSGTHVCSFSDGRGYSPDYISHRFNRVLEENNLPHIRFHELRHTCGSMLISGGVSPKLVQQYLGHERISTTMDTYVHVDPTTKQTAASKMVELLSCG